MLTSGYRIPKIFEELKNTNADIIGLEEMTPTFVRALLSQDWVRQHYYVSDNGTNRHYHIRKYHN